MSAKENIGTSRVMKTIQTSGRCELSAVTERVNLI